MRSTIKIWTDPDASSLGQYIQPPSFPKRPIKIFVRIGGNDLCEIADSVNILCLSMALDVELIRSRELRHFVISMDCLFDTSFHGQHLLCLLPDGRDILIDPEELCRSTENIISEIVNSAQDPEAAFATLSEDMQAAKEQRYFSLFV